MSDSHHWQYVACLEDFNGSTKLVVTFEDHPVLLYKTSQEILAVDNICNHLQQPLEKGRIIGGKITCPYHGACFDLRTGQAMSGPAVAPLETFSVKREGDDIFLARRSAMSPSIS